MSGPETVLLGAIAGFTIYLGLPLGRLQSQSFKLKTFLNGASAGVLLFLLFDILSHAGEEVEHSFEAAAGKSAGWLHPLGLTLVYVIGFGAGLLSLLYVSRLGRRRLRNVSLGPGAMATVEPAVARSEALRLGMTIAGAIGLHNFSEGLAIGQAAHSGAVSLALLLIIGFALHNATEGFGIIGPLAATDTRPSWRWLALAGLAGGGPTFLGTIVGTSLSSAFVFVGFLALAGGAIVYVLGELFAVGRRLSWDETLHGLLAGFLVAFGTEIVLKVAGA